MRDHAQRRAPLPGRLTGAERDFYVELRRLVDAAGLSFRALEESTSAARSDSGESCFYSKSQWGRWLNGQSRPPRKAIRKLVEKLAEDDVEAGHLVDLWGWAFVPTHYVQAPATTVATLRDIEQRDAAMPGRPDRQSEADFPARYGTHVTEYHGMPEPPDVECRRRIPGSNLHALPGQHAADRADGSGVVAPRQLPPAVRHFAGRKAELAALAGQLLEAADTVVISAVGGTAGVGKTALAVYFAHQVADHFPDGQLYVNLRGFDPTGLPVAPAEAIRGFLDAFGVPAERLPVAVEAQAALYRSVLAGRRVLVVLDNARDAEHVRPLLPGSPGCMVLVTSRNQLTSLIAADGARPVDLDLLTIAEARQLLACRLGADRVAAEAPAVEEIITCCARLPLVLSIVAARAATHPQFPLASLADELRGARGSLHAFPAGDAAADPRAVFSWSYQQLSPQAARLFRLLGLHPGPDISTHAAASLAASPTGQARAWLCELTRAHLVTERSPGRFAFHDLLRAYAVEQACAHDTEDEQKAAISRVLDHYLYTAGTASFLLHRRTRALTLPPPPPEVLPEEPPDFAAGWAWLDTEYPVLLAAIEQAAAIGRDARVWQLAWTLMDFRS
jgi:NB-ARC domain